MLKHYKGGLYTILATAEASSDIKEGEKVVIYVSLQNGDLYARGVESFFERIPNGQVSGLMRFQTLDKKDAEKEVARRMKKLGLAKAYSKKKARK